MTTDPFATQEKTPSISFKDKPIGTTYTGTVIEAPTTVQARDYDTGEPAFWPDGNKKLTVVTILDVNGEHMGLWAPKPSAMFRAIAEAQQTAGAQIQVGGTLTVTFVGEQPVERNPKLNPQKLYKVTYQPNDPFADMPRNGEVVNTSTGEVQQMNPMGAVGLNVPQPAAKQHTPEVLAALKAAGIDPATIPVQP